MFTKTRLIVALAGIAAAGSVLAQSTEQLIQRDINQQQRIEQGLQSGALNTREAGRLQREEARVDRMQANALRDGNLSQQESARINRAQNQVSRDIYREKHDAQVGNPNSASSQRMQADVQRNINQQERIQQGVQSGALTNREVSHLERREAHISRMQGRAGADGRVGVHEQQRIQGAQNRASGAIYRQKHDRQVR